MERLKSLPGSSNGVATAADAAARAGFRSAVTPGRRFRIAQVSPLFERVPPRQYGGTERIVGYLCNALARRGHQVTLFASGDSITHARLCAPTEQSLRLAAHVGEQTAAHILELALVFEQAGQFDVIHCHVDHLAFPFSRFMGTPTLHTLHGRLDVPHLRPLYQHFSDLPFVSISDAQREPLRDIPMGWLATVHHGLPPEEYPVGTGGGGYLAFLGRMSPEKRPDLAIEIARRVGLPLKIAAKIDDENLQYFEGVVRPLLDQPLVEFVGEVGGADRLRFLGDAVALLFPIDWPEPFGLVMIEALACGTPVVALRRGSVPEVIVNGTTGFIVETVDEMVEAVKRVGGIDRAECRRDVERRFTDERMTMAYEDVYADLLTSAARR
jgi:glycosyltransferase involved in cell wall biosynthesis